MEAVSPKKTFHHSEKLNLKKVTIELQKTSSQRSLITPVYTFFGLKLNMHYFLIKNPRKEIPNEILISKLNPLCETRTITT